MKILVSLDEMQRQQIEGFRRATRSRLEARRCRIILLLAEGKTIREVCVLVDCVRSTAYRTLYQFEEYGMDGLRDQRTKRKPHKATTEVREQLLSYLDRGPRDFGWQRSNWTLELLALQLARDTDVTLRTGHLRRILKEEGCRRGRPRPALRIPVRGRRQVLDGIEAIVSKASPDEEVFYVDEADIDLNPRIGLTYIRRGQQPLVLTPGKNVKHYVAGALNPRTGSITHVDGPRKNSALFIDLLQTLNHRYSKARRIHLVLDNYIIHKSKATKIAIEALGERVQLHFLPPYSPKSNRIEPLWKQLHDHVTRNHQHPKMNALLSEVEQFLINVQPFPGTKVSTLEIAS